MRSISCSSRSASIGAPSGFFELARTAVRIPRFTARSSATAFARSLATSTTSPARLSPRDSKCSRIAWRLEPPPDARIATRDLIARIVLPRGLTGKRCKIEIDRFRQRADDRHTLVRRSIHIVLRRCLRTYEHPEPAQRLGGANVAPTVPDEGGPRRVDVVLLDR